MTTSTILLLILSVFIAAGLSFYQYFYKAKNKSKINLFLAFLRFLSFLGLFLLFINPILTRKTFEIVKTPLPIIIDNSESIKDLSGNNLNPNLFEQLSNNESLKEKYDIQLYTFDKEFKSNEKVDYSGKQSLIDNVAKNLKQLYRNVDYPVVLFTDGNQTQGNDYIYSFQENTRVYPVIQGDTTTVFDLKINQINTNKYTFLKNKFPVEVFLQYNGNEFLNSIFTIKNGNQTIFKKNISFSSQNKAQSIQVLLDATSIGVQKYTASISSSKDEKNKMNNFKNFIVEVIDQRTEIAIISDIIHPDLSALKRSIEVNQQRKVTLLKPNEIRNIRDYNLLILYQPNNTFKSIFDQNKTALINTFIITGTNTDFNFLALNEIDFNFRMSPEKEDYFAAYQSDFNLFAQENIGFENFSSLENKFGTISLKGNAKTLLNASIRNIQTGNPLLTFLEIGKQRKGFLFGENIWKWRMETHLKKKSFDDFDLFTDKWVQYLTSNSTKKSLEVDYKSYYNEGENIQVTAQYFDKNYELDENAQLNIVLTNKETKQTKSYNFLKSNIDYKVEFDNLEKGNYAFTVKEKESKNSFSGNFEVLEFDIEKQFVNPDQLRLKQLATNTSGKVFFPNQLDQLTKSLMENTNYLPIQKEVVKKTPLIDWTILLLLICVFLSIEWFTRKYNGLL
ncbi:hypothetical protein FIA58_009355 [Flavobacterium jejuense]|uniref:VWA domain-containing protein n=1 Tax=Flavobacterium jejuense TaxID=1544455 RepID=A0ABX0IPY9_9FLAO|nr:hypothetical protein [Flavobacterium jejuense]NHN25880.1 hypothetical protein [Flavobacterium jejuense]